MSDPAAALLDALPGRDGHFRLESGYHASLWLTLDGLFVDSNRIAPLVFALADRLRPHPVTAVCGPMIGGALLAQQIAAILGLRFYYTQPTSPTAGSGTFTAAYDLPASVRRNLRGQSVAVVDDVISAASSVRATMAALTGAGATTTVAGSLMTLGEVGLRHFASLGIPVETLHHKPFDSWPPGDCPLCRRGVALENPN